MPPFVAHALVPLSSHSSVASRYSARVRMDPISLPASGSEAQNEPSFTSPGVPNICGIHSPICSGVPLLATETAARALPTSDSAIPASPQNSSSKATGMPSPLGSSHCWPKKSSEYSPILAASSRMGQGVSSRSSHSAPAGLIVSAAKPCTQSRISRRSGPRSRENFPAGPVLAGPVLAGPVLAGPVLAAAVLAAAVLAGAGVSASVLISVLGPGDRPYVTEEQHDGEQRSEEVPARRGLR